MAYEYQPTPWKSPESKHYLTPMGTRLNRNKLEALSEQHGHLLPKPHNLDMGDQSTDEDAVRAYHDVRTGDQPNAEKIMNIAQVSDN